jgi:hypothetical protein
MSLVLRAFGIWNWITNLYLWTYSLSKRYIRAIADAHVEEVYIFFDGGFPLVTRASVPNSLCVYRPSTKTFVFSVKVDTVKRRFNLLSAKLVSSKGSEDLGEFFAEAAWVGSEKGPTASQAVIAAMLDRGVHLTSTCLGRHTLEVEDDTGTTHTITDFSQPLNV